jgi:hypothetical protein
LWVLTELMFMVHVTKIISCNWPSALITTISLQIENCFGKCRIIRNNLVLDRLCGLVVRVLGYRSGGPGSIPGTTRKKNSGPGTGSTQSREYDWGATW